MGVPNDILLNMLDDLEHKHPEDINGGDAFKDVCSLFKTNKSLKATDKKMLLHYYPVFSDKSEDIRANEMECFNENKAHLAVYAFPSGCEPKHSATKPPNKLVPMMFWVGEKRNYIT